MSIKIRRQLSRRSLISGVPAVVLAGQALAPVRLPRKIRIGMIGLDAHPNIVLGELPRLPDAELVAVADASPEDTARVASRLGTDRVRQYGDHRLMLEREKLDVVGVCNPNGDRAAAVLACAERGIHIAAEKPLALNRQDLERIRAAVRKNSVQLTMLLPMRFSPEYLAVREVARSGEIGEVLQISAQKSYQLGDRPEWMKRKESYGGTIPWIGIHMIDLMRWTSGREFTEAFSLASHVGFPEIGDMENVTASVFSLDNRGLAVLRMDYLRPKQAGSHGDDRLRLAGTKGVVEYQAATGVTVTSAGGDRRLEKLPAERSLFCEFLQAVYTGSAHPISLDDVYRVCEITIAAQEAAEKRQLVACG